jgi:hypothetical protein
MNRSVMQRADAMLWAARVHQTEVEGPHGRAWTAPLPNGWLLVAGYQAATLNGLPKVARPPRFAMLIAPTRRRFGSPIAAHRGRGGRNLLRVSKRRSPRHAAGAGTPCGRHLRLTPE